MDRQHGFALYQPSPYLQHSTSAAEPRRCDFLGCVLLVACVLSTHPAQHTDRSSRSFSHSTAVCSCLLVHPFLLMDAFSLPTVCISSVIQGSIWMSTSFTELPALSRCGKAIFSIYLRTGVALSSNCTPLCSSDSLSMGGTPAQDPILMLSFLS